MTAYCIRARTGRLRAVTAHLTAGREIESNAAPAPVDRGPLDGVVVLDLTQMVGVPQLMMNMALW
jgi:hypothetical protein